MSSRKLNTDSVSNGYESREREFRKIRDHKRREERDKRRFPNADMIDSIEASGSIDNSPISWFIQKGNEYQSLGSLTKRQHNPFYINNKQYYEFTQALLTREQLNRIKNVVPDNDSIEGIVDLDDSIMTMTRENYYTIQHALDSEAYKRLQDENIKKEREYIDEINRRSIEEGEREKENQLKAAILAYVTEGYESPKVKQNAEKYYDNGEFDSLKGEIGVMQEYLREKRQHSTPWHALEAIDEMKDEIMYYLRNTEQINDDENTLKDASKDYDNGMYNNLKTVYFEYNGDMKKAVDIYKAQVAEAERLEKQIAEAKKQKGFDEQREIDEKKLNELRANIQRANIEDELRAKQNIFGFAMSAVGNAAKIAADDLRQRIIAGLRMRQLPSEYHSKYYSYQSPHMSDNIAGVARLSNILHGQEYERKQITERQGIGYTGKTTGQIAREAGIRLGYNEGYNQSKSGGKRKSKKSKKSKKTLKK